MPQKTKKGKKQAKIGFSLKRVSKATKSGLGRPLKRVVGKRGHL